MGAFDTTGSATITNITQAGLGSVYVDNTASVTWVGGGTTTVTGSAPVGAPSSCATPATSAVNLNFTNSHLDGNASAGVWVLGNTNPALAVNLSATSTTFDNNAFYGISSPRGTMGFSGTASSVSGNGAGAAAEGYTPGGVLLTDAASVNSLTMRSVAVGGNTGNQIAFAGTSASTFDLGTATAAGNVAFKALGATSAAVSLSAPIAGSAVGDTWLPSELARAEDDVRDREDVEHQGRREKARLQVGRHEAWSVIRWGRAERHMRTEESTALRRAREFSLKVRDDTQRGARRPWQERTSSSRWLGVTCRRRGYDDQRPCERKCERARFRRYSRDDPSLLPPPRLVRVDRRCRRCRELPRRERRPHRRRRRLRRRRRGVASRKATLR